MSAPDISTAAAAVRRALALLERASDDWRNGAPCESGSLHWPVAVNLGRRELRQALEALENPAWSAAEGRDVEDAKIGMAWWNGLSRAERRYWLEVADSAVPADAWQAFSGSMTGSRP